MPAQPSTGRRGLRTAGWFVAFNAIAFFIAVTLGGTAREAAQRFALWCGLS